jgi:hypothetical protein
MTIKHPSHLAPLTLGALLCAPIAAFAQSAQAPGSPVAPPAAGAPTTAAPAAPGKDVEARVEQRINQLHSQLRIIPAQQSQWNQFAEVMRSNARDMDAAMQQRAQQFATMTAVQNMESYEKLAQLHAEHVQKLASAFATLYDALPAAQKQLADQAFRANAANQPQHAMGPATTRTE